MVHIAHIHPYQWTVFYPPQFYMDHNRWIKYMSHLSSICCYSPLNTQFLLYDCHEIHFDDRALNILRSHHIKYFILKACEYVHDHPNDNGPNLKLNNMYNNAIMKWKRKHGTLKFTPAHINTILV